MSVTVKRITLWRAEVDNRPGVLADFLRPLAAAGADLQVVMAYRFPGNETRGAVELCPVTTRKATAAAQAAGLSPSGIATLLVEGDNKPGLGHSISRALADEGLNLAFLVTQVIGRRYSSVMAFESDEAAKRAAAVIRRAAAGGRKR